MRILLGFLALITLPLARGAGLEAFPIGRIDGSEAGLAWISPEALDPDRERRLVLIISPSTSPKHDRPITSGVHLVSYLQVPPAAQFPPAGTAYSNYEWSVWRWIQMLAPDAVVSGIPSLTKALGDSVPCYHSRAFVPDDLPISQLHDQAIKRANRGAIEIAAAIGKHYGQQFKSIQYQSAMAIVGRARLAHLTGGRHADDSLRGLVAQAPPMRTGKSSTYAGHLIFAELGMVQPAVAAARIAIEKPDHKEMSDSVFMVCPLLASAGRLASDRTFFAASCEHLERIQHLCLRQDGLYRHSPLDDAAWGRGNGFPTLGLAWVLAEMPEDFPGRAKVLASFRDHIAALAKHQDRSGMWHQVIDQPSSYREFTCTCMITYAILRGMRSGWLERERYEALADRAWEAIKLRISLDGYSFTDACTGTGKQKSLEDYFLRKAILGPDARSGGMALMVATERAAWERSRDK